MNPFLHRSLWIDFVSGFLLFVSSSGKYKASLLITLLFIVPVVERVGDTLSAQEIDFTTLEKGTVTDNEGNVYNTIKFGDTWWMTSNLRTKHYNDGSAILQMTQLIDANDETNDWTWWQGAGRWGYTNLDASTFDTYGLQYSWPAAVNTSNSGVCPSGWSLPDTADWVNLGRLIVGANKVVNVLETKPTPTGGTETTFLPLYVKDLGQYLKTDNGKVLGANRYGEPTWLNGGVWPNNPNLANECNGSGMNLIPAGTVGESYAEFGKAVYYWSPNFVHSNLQGAGRRYIYFSNASHDLTVGMFHQACLTSIRCIKKEASSTSVTPNTSEPFTIVPNGTYRTFTISGAKGTYQLLTLQGHLVQTGWMDGETTISLQLLPMGIYLLQTNQGVAKIINH